MAKGKLFEKKAQVESECLVERDQTIQKLALNLDITIMALREARDLITEAQPWLERTAPNGICNKVKAFLAKPREIITDAGQVTNAGRGYTELELDSILQRKINGGLE